MKIAGATVYNRYDGKVNIHWILHKRHISYQKSFNKRHYSGIYVDSELYVVCKPCYLFFKRYVL